MALAVEVAKVVLLVLEVVRITAFDERIESVTQVIEGNKLRCSAWIVIDDKCVHIVLFCGSASVLTRCRCCFFN